MLKKRQKMGLFSAVMLALNSLIGSGWLFGSGSAAKIAGPAAIISWVIGAIVLIVISINYIELGTMFPESGGMSHYAQYSHGPLLGFIAAWSNWIALLTLVPMESVAAVQYMSSWPWQWSNWTKNFMVKGQVSSTGILVVASFMLIFTLINFWSVKLMTHFTNLIAIFKVVMPTLTIFTLLISGFHIQNFGSNWSTFMPYGSRSIFAATSVAGIITSYNAFQTIINVGGELKNPRKNIVRGVLLSMGITAIIYIFLQVTFIGAVRPQALVKAGWHGINFTSPFADLALLLGVNWLVILLYLDAFISPFGTGVAFVANSSRTLAAMTHTRHLPQWLGRLNRRYMIPRFAMVADYVIGLLLVTLFRNWNLLATVTGTANLITYLTGPVTLIALRKLAPNLNRPFAPKIMRWLAPMSFVLTSLAIYWSMWPTTAEVIVVIALGLPVYLYYEIHDEHSTLAKQLFSSWWLFLYLIWLAAISYLGSSTFGGHNLLPYPWDFVAVIVMALVFYGWGVHARQRQIDPMAVKVNHRVDF